MYTPITKRVKVAQHKSSVAKQMAKPNENSNEITEEAIVQDEQGNKLTGKATGKKGTTQTVTCDQKVKEGAFATKEECLKAVKDTYGSVNPTKEGLANNTITTPGDAKFSYEQELSEGQRGSSIDLMGPQELRGNTRAGKIAARNVKKASKQLKRMQKKFDAGKINQETLDAYKDELKNTVARSKNIGQQATGMRNRYITQRMEYDRKLKGAQDAGPVKAPEGTRTQSDFESDFKKGLGINGGSSDPQTTTTPTSSFSEMAATSYKPITLSTGALFEGLDSSISAFANKVKKGGVGKMTNKPGSFKMKGYRSNR
jgi:hypothetical protein